MVERGHRPIAPRGLRGQEAAPSVLSKTQSPLRAGNSAGNWPQG